MRIVLVLVTCFLISCGTNNVLPTTNSGGFETQVYDFTPISVKTPTDSLTVYEMRFTSINSAKDAMVMMTQQYGKCNSYLEGKHQDNLSQMVWENVNLLGDQSRYLIIADGAETQSLYFASLLVFDTQDNDCLNPTYKNRQTIIDSLASKMARRNMDSRWYNKL